MRAKNVIVLLLLAVLCAVGYYVVQDRSSGKDGALPAVWPKFDRADVTVIEMKGQGDSLRLQRREGVDERWDVVAGTEPLRADANAVDDLLQALSRQQVRDRIDASKGAGDGASQFGLAKDTIDVKITLAAGEPIQLRYGAVSRQGGSVYMDNGPGTHVWVVARDALDLVISGVKGGMRAKRVFDATLHDVETLEVVKGGVTHAEVTRDKSYIWKIRQPFQGYAHPTKFETELNRIVNVELERWEELGAVDLVKYGLDAPRWTVRITPKGEARKPQVLLLGADTEQGVHAMEEGTKVVVFLPRRFFEAATADPMSYRDRSFSRFGLGDATIDVAVRGHAYKLEKAHAQTDVVIGTERRPADGDKVNRFLDSIREWQTAEFRDGMDPKDAGIDEKQFIELTRISAGHEGEKIALLVGADAPDGPGGAKRVYGQRKADGGVEVVDAGPLAQAALGPEQFFRKDASNWPVDSIEGFDREKGRGEEGEKVQSYSVTRDLDGADKAWRGGRGGQTGTPDGAAVNEILTQLQSLKVLEWLPYDSAKDNERMGFKPPLADTLTLTVHLHNVLGTDPEPKLYVGKRRSAEQGGGYYARIPGKDGTGSWAFILADDVVEKLKAPLSKD